MATKSKAEAPTRLQLQKMLKRVKDQQDALQSDTAGFQEAFRKDSEAASAQGRCLMLGQRGQALRAYEESLVTKRATLVGMRVALEFAIGQGFMEFHRAFASHEQD